MNKINPRYLQPRPRHDRALDKYWRITFGSGDSFLILTDHLIWMQLHEINNLLFFGRIRVSRVDSFYIFTNEKTEQALRNIKLTEETLPDDISLLPSPIKQEDEYSYKECCDVRDDISQD